MTTSLRRLGLLAVVVVALGAAALAAAPTASAHAKLVRTSPAQDGTVKSPKSAVSLTFNEPVQSKFAAVAVTGPDGAKFSTGDPKIADATVEQPVTSFPTAGEYEVGWRVVSADGHPVSGKFSFTVKESAVSSASPTASATASPTPAADRGAPADDRSFVERHAAHLLIGAVVVLLGVAVVLWERRRRRG